MKNFNFAVQKRISLTRSLYQLTVLQPNKPKVLQCLACLLWWLVQGMTQGLVSHRSRKVRHILEVFNCIFVSDCAPQHSFFFSQTLVLIILLILLSIIVKPYNFFFFVSVSPNMNKITSKHLNFTFWGNAKYSCL